MIDQKKQLNFSKRVSNKREWVDLYCDVFSRNPHNINARYNMYYF